VFAQFCQDRGWWRSSQPGSREWKARSVRMSAREFVSGCPTQADFAWVGTFINHRTDSPPRLLFRDGLWNLKRYQHTHDLHFITFSCYRRQPLLGSPRTRNLFETALERTRLGYQFFVTGYVVMPEHVHLLVSEPRRSTLAATIQALKQSVARRLVGPDEHLWQKRYYDFNVWTEKKCVEKLFGTCTAIPSLGALWSIQRIGPGAVFDTT